MVVTNPVLASAKEATDHLAKLVKEEMAAHDPIDVVAALVVTAAAVAGSAGCSKRASRLMKQAATQMRRA